MIPPLLVAHASDLHVGDGPVALARAGRVLAHLGAMAPSLSALVLTGDLTATGAPEEYAALTRLLDAHIPPGLALVTCPGNHDEGTAYGAFVRGLAADLRRPEATTTGGDTRVDGPEPPGWQRVHRAHLLAALTVLALDSTVAGHPHGELGDDGAAWLGPALAAAPAARPLILALHHPPARVHSPWLDTMVLDDAPRLGQLLDRAPRRPDLILTGHTHVASAAAFHGIPVRGAGAVRSTLVSAWEAPGVAGGEEQLSEALPPMVAVHVLDALGAAAEGATAEGGPAGLGPGDARFEISTRWRVLP